MVSRGVETSGLLLREVVLMTDLRGISTAWTGEVIQLGIEAHIAQREHVLVFSPQMTFVLCPWKQAVSVGL